MFRALFCCLANSSIALWAYTKSQKLQKLPNARISGCARRWAGKGPQKGKWNRSMVELGAVIWLLSTILNYNISSELWDFCWGKKRGWGRGEYLSRQIWNREIWGILKLFGVLFEKSSIVFKQSIRGTPLLQNCIMQKVVFVGQLLNSAPDRAVFAFITPTWGLY